MEFEDYECGKETREQATVQNYCKKNNLSSHWVPINFLKQSIRIGYSSTNIVLRRQLPIVLAEAITIYKGQGSTHTDVAVHSPQKLNRNELYVACSRVTTFSGLYFVDFDGSFILRKLNNIANDKSIKAIEKLEKERPVQFDLHFLQDYVNTNCKTFIFANIQSLHKYFPLVKADKCFSTAYFIFLVETWTFQSDIYEIDGYRCIYRHDCKGQRRHAYGSIIFAKEEPNLSNFEIIFESNAYNKNKSIAHNVVAFTYNDYCLSLIHI